MQRVPKHIYWSAGGALEVDLDDPAEKAWWLRQVLVNGTMADVQELDIRDIEGRLPKLHLPAAVAALWRDFFARRHSRTASPESP